MTVIGTVLLNMDVAIVGVTVISDLNRDKRVAK